MKSRYNGLRTIGTLALILAWVLLILGIAAGIASWVGLGALQQGLDTNFGPLPFLSALPGVLGGILGFLVYYAIGKVLRLLVDVDERTMQLRQAVESPAAPDDSLAEASGEMKRQAKLIAANLEATQDIQRQLAALESKLGVSAVAPAIAAGSTAAVAAAATKADEAAQVAEDTAEQAQDAAETVTETVADASADATETAATDGDAG